jgi:hypothetical protein
MPSRDDLGLRVTLMRLNVRYWPKADMAACTAHVRLWG